MLFKNYPSPSPRRLKVPVNMRFAGVSRGYGGLLTFHIAFTEPSPNLHPLVVKDRWKICESKFGMRIGRNAFVQGICANIGEGERYFSKSPARGALMRKYIIYAPKTDWYLCVLARPSHKTAVASDKIAVYAQNSLENFPHISCSRQKVVRLFRKSYHFSAY